MILYLLHDTRDGSIYGQPDTPLAHEVQASVDEARVVDDFPDDTWSQILTGHTSPDVLVPAWDAATTLWSRDPDAEAALRRQALLLGTDPASTGAPAE